MEHIVQIAIGVDDNKIKEICEQTAAKQVIDDITKFSHGTDYYGKLNKNPDKLTGMFKDEVAKSVNAYMEVHMDDVIAQVVKSVTASIMRTKKMKEAIGEIVETQLNTDDSIKAGEDNGD